MINIVVSKKFDNYELSMNGHACYSNSGNDIVCAGASAIGYALLGYLENCDSVDDIDAVERSGELEIICKCEGDIKVRTAFDVAVIGFLQLEKAYPQNVRVEADDYF